MSDESQNCSPERVQAQLHRMLESEEFRASDRNRRFLEYVVEEALAGRADRIKAYSVATIVFGRDESFDPQLDPIVRIEAGRLRRSLERYYLTAGSADPIRISVPKGSYVPAFEAVDVEPAAEESNDHPSLAKRRQSALGLLGRSTWFRAGTAATTVFAAALVGAIWIVGWALFADPAAEGPAARHGPSIFVASFDQEGANSTVANFSHGFTRDVIVGLTRFNDLFVFGPDTTLRYAGDGKRPAKVDELEVDFVLSGVTSMFADHFEVKALLNDARSGQYIWAAHFRGPLVTGDVLKARDDIADQVARALAHPYGVIFTNRVKETEGKPPELLTSYDCIIRFYQYWRTYRRDIYAQVRACLEKAVVNDPDYAEAHAALSLMYSDAYRFGFDDGAHRGDPRHRAMKLAQRAVELAPDSTRGYHALSLAYWLTNEVERSLATARAGLALNPNDTELMAELGMRYGWRNQWETGLPLMREAFARNPGQPSGYRLGLFMYNYLNGRYQEALSEARMIEVPYLVYGHAAIAMACAKLGHNREAEEAVQRVLAVDSSFGDNIFEHLSSRNVHPDLIPIIVDGLRDAGMRVPDTHDPNRT